MKDMEENGVLPNYVTYGVDIESCYKEGRCHLCCKIVELLCQEGKVDVACVLWKKLLKRNFTPDNAIYSMLISWLCKGGKFKEARKLFDEFEKGFLLSFLTNNTLISTMREEWGVARGKAIMGRYA
ncbi:hypothetical protein AMTR_s00015p00258900 [Amborella trichopoda]|uniref:Pentacotripeptide-repeat region of PRORP domain-containing protein n=1 Tax=Amborella trichopoda TaxID=13333 RepID=W1PG22_AMBTC|nr:hypothetical protein AMTR_s00015p00258900 [Amborella trichopoda]